MVTELATVAASEWPACTVETLVGGRRVEAAASAKLEELWILLHPGDLVTLELATGAPQVTYRWWRATVTAVDGRRVTIDPPPSGRQRNPYASLPVDRELSVEPGDTVVCSPRQPFAAYPWVQDPHFAVIDRETNGVPIHPDWFAAAYAEVQPLTRRADACLHLPAEDPPIDVALVRRLLRSQFPAMADLDLERIDAWENAMFRAGDDLAVRLTRGRWALGQLEREHQWLHSFAPQLPLAIPQPVALGEPGEGYPWSWSVRTWIDGERATPDRLTKQHQSAADLAEFLAALQSIDPTGGPVAGEPPNWHVWRPLTLENERVQERLDQAPDVPEVRFLRAVWQDALSAEDDWDGAAVWLHGDLDPTNVLARDGRLAAVIDWGVMSVGDRAYDYSAAWRLLNVDARQTFRKALAIDDATWARARGWAVFTSYAEVLADDDAPRTN